MYRAVGIWVLCVLALPLQTLAQTSSAPPRLRGFTLERSLWERRFEDKLQALPSPVECDALLKRLTHEPHVAGSPENARVGDFIAEQYRNAGLSVETPTFDVLLSYPKRAELSIVGEPGVPLARTEDVITADPDSARTASLIPWNAYSPSCDLTADVVYVNRGSAADYDDLARRGVDVRGRIVLARYFGGYRGGKALEAERRGVAAVLVFSDPIDDGWFQGDVYPNGPWGPSSHFQRGSNVYDFIVPGDPLTPGWPSVAGARRLAESESRILPKVPMMPISARDASEILARLGGGPVPVAWQGVALTGTYHVGPGPVRLHLVIENTREIRTIRNIIGRIEGSDEPESIVLLSNHYDAWVYGAVDPSSGTATMISLARALGALVREGWRPRRTIVFGSWDSEEYTLTGSTEWGEEHEANLRKNAVVCLNVDASTSGPHFAASASPLLFEPLRDVASVVQDPGAAGKSVADTWREHADAENIRGYSASSATSASLPVSILGSGSDYTVFFNRLGVPSVDMLFDGPYGVYHSVYDSYHWMATQGDPGFKYHAAMARLTGVLALRFANADVLPFDTATYGAEIAGYVESLGTLQHATAVKGELADLAKRARAWSASASEAREVIERALQRGSLDKARVARYNAWMMSLERTLLADDGLPDRPWFRHLVYAPLPSYEAETLPAIREALVAGRDPKPHIAILSKALEQARRDADLVAR